MYVISNFGMLIAAKGNRNALPLSFDVPKKHWASKIT